LGCGLLGRGLLGHERSGWRASGRGWCGCGTIGGESARPGAEAPPGALGILEARPSFPVTLTSPSCTKIVEDPAYEETFGSYRGFDQIHYPCKPGS
jgi:hypothetical protein